MRKILFLIVFSFVFVINAFALNVGQVVNYNSSTYKVIKIDNTTKMVLLCPYYNNEQFFQYADWGWFYGQKCIQVPLTYFEPKKPVKKEITTQNKTESTKKLLKLATDPEYLNNLTATEFRKLFRKITDLAVMHPTKAKVAAYMYMTNFLRLKSLVFAHAVINYSMGNSKYYTLRKIGETSWSIRNYWQHKREQGLRVMHEHENSIGVFAFIKYGCPFCEKEIPVLQWFKSDYHVNVLLVSYNKCPSGTFLPCVVNPGAFKAFNVQSMPTMLLVIRQKNNLPKFYPIGVGLTDKVTMFNRAAYYVRGYYEDRLYTDKNFLKLLNKETDKND